MNKIVTGLSVVAVFGLAFVANAYAMGSMHKNDMAKNYDVNRLIGTQVKSSDGEGLGSINNFVFSPGGRVIFAVLDHEGRLWSFLSGLFRFPGPHLRKRELSSTSINKHWIEPWSSTGPRP